MALSKFFYNCSPPKFVAFVLRRPIDVSNIDVSEVSIFRINLKTSCRGTLDDLFNFCKTNKIIGIGWQLDKVPKNLSDCKNLGTKKYPGRAFSNAINRIGEMKANDLVWTRHDGFYYICRVILPWRYNNSPNNVYHDMTNIVGVDDFVKVGTIDEVPGKVVNSFRPPSTAQRIRTSYIKELSMKIYNEKSGVNYYPKFSFSYTNILDALQAEDVEEIVCLYLQLNKNYLLYGSTNKISTEKYECVLVEKNNFSKCYPQVKTGNVSLNGNDYVHLTENGNKVYLFAVSQNYIKAVNNNDIIYLDKNDILKFMTQNKKLLPERIQYWM